jgi:hypothetical protein
LSAAARRRTPWSAARRQRLAIRGRRIRGFGVVTRAPAGSVRAGDSAGPWARGPVRPPRPACRRQVHPSSGEGGGVQPSRIPGRRARRRRARSEGGRSPGGRSRINSCRAEDPHRALASIRLLRSGDVSLRRLLRPRTHVRDAGHGASHRSSVCFCIIAGDVVDLPPPPDEAAADESPGLPADVGPEKDRGSPRPATVPRAASGRPRAIRLSCRRHQLHRVT